MLIKLSVETLLYDYVILSETSFGMKDKDCIYPVLWVRVVCVHLPLT